MLQIKNLKFKFNNEIFQYSLTANHGEILSILGKSGAGKSTLLNLINGLLEPMEGEIIFDGQNITMLRPHERPVSTLFQQDNLFNHLSNYKNIALGISSKLKLSNNQHKELHMMAQRLGIEKLLNKKPGQLSGGQQQRVAIARCLLRETKILLLDEPFASLEPSLRGNLLNLIKFLAKERNWIVFMVSHFPQDAEKISDTILFIHDREILLNGRTSKILNNTTNQHLANYLDNYK
ncbi:thiamine ABC transporter ATP-binding protein [Paraphotobacterium marinum]|uniref:Thiamine ABC transporter ATP-binding protein n=1 Tax=Paraphotobacterium marinum TaxID=1755811 RepID=A0A220VDJ7_9GAMM|nr:ATP-binding cassette domain-containing protein [Paraphotobacterium marinum]ASK78296.1 thiamine ABC transporter ATP-binding protein [Paraphotobacterium marinum]